MNMIKTTAGGFALAAIGTTAFAGGLDRATLSPAILFETGSYVELSFASTSPSINAGSFAGGPLAGSPDPAQTFKTAQLGFKTDINDKISAALTFNNNPFGVDINYAGFATTHLEGISSLTANLSGTAVTFMGKYKINDRVSAYGGIKSQSVSGTADLTALGVTSLAIGADRAESFIIGAAYEIPDIALRVSATYESAATFTPDVFIAGGGPNTGQGEINTPESFLLEFQSGIAPNTLLFGSIRHAKWGDAPVLLSPTFGSAEISDFDDSTTYSIGVGRKFSEKFSGSLTLTHAPSSCTDVSLLAPTCKQNTLSIGGEYQLGNGAAIAAGVSFRKYDTATSEASTGSIVFDGNTLTTVGMKLSKSF
jgi:long-subunit fatty acid transport protein